MCTDPSEVHTDFFYTRKHFALCLRFYTTPTPYILSLLPIRLDKNELRMHGNLVCIEKACMQITQ